MTVHSLLTARHSAATTAVRRRTARQRNSTCASALNTRLLTHRAAIAKWALANGVSLNLTALTLIIGAKQRFSAATDQPFTAWQVEWLDEFVHLGLPQWGRQHGTPLPPSTGETLWAYLRALDDADALHPDSSLLADLHHSLASIAGLNPDGSRSRHPAGRALPRNPVGGVRRR
jgi:hypothetical protein